MNDFSQLGSGAVLLLLILREVFTFVGKKKGTASANDYEDKLEELKALSIATHGYSKDLHAWHNVKDSDGVFTWMVRRSLEDSISKLSDALTLLVETNRDIHNELKANRREVRELKEAIKK